MAWESTVAAETSTVESWIVEPVIIERRVCTESVIDCKTLIGFWESWIVEPIIIERRVCTESVIDCETIIGFWECRVVVEVELLTGTNIDSCLGARKVKAIII